MQEKGNDVEIEKEIRLKIEETDLTDKGIRKRTWRYPMGTQGGI